MRKRLKGEKLIDTDTYNRYKVMTMQ